MVVVDASPSVLAYVRGVSQGNMALGPSSKEPLQRALERSLEPACQELQDTAADGWFLYD